MTRVPGFAMAAGLSVALALAVSGCGGVSPSPPGAGPVAPPPPDSLPQACPEGQEGTPPDCRTPLDLPGAVRVIDADTVDIDGTRYRLFGIDAPESRQTCRAWGRTWDCGAAATEALRTRAAGMSCAGSDTDRYGRTLGVCSSGGEDLNAWLVAGGWALAYRQYSDDYADEEEDARSNRRGVHRGAFVEPWDWRRGERLDGEDTFSWIASGPLDAGALADRLLRGEDSGFRGYLLDDSVYGLADGTVAVSFGAWSGTNPTGIGGGVWRGRVVGLDGREAVEGRAEIRIDDFRRPEADVVFAGIQDAGGRVRADMRWEDLPVVRGRFRAGAGADRIEGRFWGAGHEEAGGVFERNGIAGAFGGERR